jgi:hypothetical protein
LKRHGRWGFLAIHHEVKEPWGKFRLTGTLREGEPARKTIRLLDVEKVAFGFPYSLFSLLV